jgi:hypothetical protein
VIVVTNVKIVNKPINNPNGVFGGVTRHIIIIFIFIIIIIIIVTCQPFVE